MSPVWVPVIAGAVGALGAVLAQVVSAAFTARRERDRWAEEDKRREADRAEARRARSLDVRLALYEDWVGVLDEILEHYFTDDVTALGLMSHEEPRDDALDRIVELVKRTRLLAPPEVATAVETFLDVLAFAEFGSLQSAHAAPVGDGEDLRRNGAIVRGGTVYLARLFRADLADAEIPKVDFRDWPSLPDTRNLAEVGDFMRIRPPTGGAPNPPDDLRLGGADDEMHPRGPAESVRPTTPAA